MDESHQEDPKHCCPKTNKGKKLYLQSEWKILIKFFYIKYIFVVFKISTNVDLSLNQKKCSLFIVDQDEILPRLNKIKDISMKIDIIYLDARI